MTGLIAEGNAVPNWTADPETAPTGSDEHIASLERENARLRRSLAAAETKSDQLLDNVPDAIVVRSPEGEILFANAAAAGLLGAENGAALVGRDISDFVDPSSLSDSKRYGANAAEHGEARRRVYMRMRKVDGSTVDVANCGQRILWQGKSSVIISMREISDLRRSEKDSRAGELKFRSLFSLAPSAMLVYDSFGKIMLVNDRAAQVFGSATPDAMQESDIRDWVVSPASGGGIPFVDPLRSDGATTGSGEPVRSRHRRADGVVFESTMQTAAMMYQDRPAAMMIVEDIQAVADAEKEAQDTEHRYRSLVQLNPDAILVHRDGHILFANRAAASLFKVHDDSMLVGRDIFDFLDPREHERVASFREEALQVDGKIDHFEVSAVRTDGKSFTAATLATSCSWDNGPARMVILRDISERKRSEEEAFETAGKFREILDCCPEAIYIGQDEKVVYANQAAAEIFGAAHPRDLLGQSPIDFVDPSERDAWSKARQTYIENGRDVIDAERVQIRLDGTPFLAERTARRITWNGRMAAIVQLRDITRRRELENEEKESEARYRHLFEFSPDAFYVVKSGRIVLVNESACEIFRAEAADDLVGIASLTLIDPSEHKRMMERRGDVIANQRELETIAALHVRLDGEVFHAESAASPIMWKGDRAMLVRVRDVEQGWQAQQEIDRVRAQYEAIVESQDELIIRLLPDGRMTFANRAYCEFRGWPMDDYFDHNIFERLEPDRRGIVESLLERVFSTGQREIHEAVNCDVNGREHVCQWVVAPIASPEGDYSEVQMVGRDITALRHAEALLMDRMNELERFAYVASHDLQEPLRMVTSYCELLDRRYGDTLDEDGQEFVRFAVDGARRMSAMITGLLEYARLGEEEAERSNTDLNDTVDSVLADLQGRVAETNAEISVGSLPTVWADPIQMHRLFLNLIGNCLKFAGDEPPKISISYDEDRGFHRIVVTDNGIGLPPENSAEAFELFKRLHPASSGGGSGMGLAICKRIVEHHGGSIRIEPPPAGGGTAISVAFPM